MAAPHCGQITAPAMDVCCICACCISCMGRSIGPRSRCHCPGFCVVSLVIEYILAKIMRKDKEKKSNKRKTVAKFHCDGCFFSVLMSECEFYHSCRRCSFGINILSSGVMPKASYQASIWGRAPFTRHWLSEWGSLLVRLRISASVMFPAHTPA